MTVLRITLPDEMIDWIDETIDSGRYGDPDTYVYDLIQKDRDRRAAIASMQHHVDEGLASGISPSSMQDILESLQAIKD